VSIVLTDPYPVPVGQGPLLAKRVTVPGSKSITNRALILSALAEGETRLEGALFSDDSRRMMECLEKMGIGIRAEPAKNRVYVKGCGGRLPLICPALSDEATLFVGNAGTAARFLPPLAALGQGRYRFDGDSRMHHRPMRDLEEALKDLGAGFEHRAKLGAEAPSTTGFPFDLIASGLSGGPLEVDITASSQFASGLLMAGPGMQQRLDLTATGQRSELPYVQMTVEMMKAFGAKVAHQAPATYHVHPGQLASPGTYAIEPDLSTAGYFFAAAALLGGKVTVLGASRASLQQDIRLLVVLRHMGCSFYEYQEGQAYQGAVGLTLERDPDVPLSGLEVDMNAFSDQALTLAAVAPFCSSPVSIRGIGHIRHQECDRIAAMVANLRAMGVTVDEHEDGVRIYPCQKPRGAEIQTFKDHRVAMAFALMGLRVPGMSIQDPACTAKTFEGFWDALQSLTQN
jgi:3-phosphoshikimate 1-carboxyvinyltransferase